MDIDLVGTLNMVEGIETPNNNTILIVLGIAYILLSVLYFCDDYVVYCCISSRKIGNLS